MLLDGTAILYDEATSKANEKAEFLPSPLTPPAFDIDITTAMTELEFVLPEKRPRADTEDEDEEGAGGENVPNRWNIHNADPIYR